MTARRRSSTRSGKDGSRDRRSVIDHGTPERYRGYRNRAAESHGRDPRAGPPHRVDTDRGQPAQVARGPDEGEGRGGSEEPGQLPARRDLRRDRRARGGDGAADDHGRSAELASV